MSSTDKSARPYSLVNFFRRRWAYLATPLLIAVAGITAASWWMTEPLEEANAAPLTNDVSASAALPGSAQATAAAALALVPSGSTAVGSAEACTQPKPDS